MHCSVARLRQRVISKNAYKTPNLSCIREFNVYILVTLGLFEFIDGSEHLIMLKIPSIVTLQEWFNTQFWLFLIIDSDILKIFSNYDGLPYGYYCSLCVFRCFCTNNKKRKLDLAVAVITRLILWLVVNYTTTLLRPRQFHVVTVGITILRYFQSFFGCFCFHSD